ncbi:hypothetical protein JST99_03905 [Candidatus Dependentiae bacterium]|nr:hypothetical protein [Candidatus Dependentiae bacterium]MCC7415369.1 hypothetical protein [Campylobacterota bacterium]
MTCEPIVHVSHFYSVLVQALALLLTIGMVAHFLRKKGLFLLRGLVQQEQDQLQALEDEKRTLAQTQTELDQKIKDQAVLFEHLTRAMEQWRHAQEKKIEAEHKRYQELMVTARHHRQQQQAMIQEMYVAKQVVPIACKQAREALTATFSSPEKADSFLSALCDRIESAA